MGKFKASDKEILHGTSVPIVCAALISVQELMRDCTLSEQILSSRPIHVVVVVVVRSGEGQRFFWTVIAATQ